MQETNSKEVSIIKVKKFDLEDRTLVFAMNVRELLKQIPRTISSIEYGKQVIRSSASVGANYIEANESLGSKDFLMHMKICRKEAKESRYWLRLLDIKESEAELSLTKSKLIVEAYAFVKIFNSIITKSS